MPNPRLPPPQQQQAQQQQVPSAPNARPPPPQQQGSILANAAPAPPPQQQQVNQLPPWAALGLPIDMNFPGLPHHDAAQAPAFPAHPPQLFALQTPANLAYGPMAHTGPPFLPTPPNMLVANGISVPGYLVQRVHGGEPICMDFLHPTNLLKLPSRASDFNPTTALKNLAKVNNFHTWQEAFSVYVAIMGRKEGATVEDNLNLIGYMILLSVMARNFPWSHISAYDNSFRRSVLAGVDWKVIDNNIWLATAASHPLSQPSAQPASSLDVSSLPAASKPAKLPKSAAAVAKEKERPAPAKQPGFFPCFFYNLSGCSDPTCTRRHACVICEADGHNKHECPDRKQSSGSGKNKKRRVRSGDKGRRYEDSD